MSDSPASEIDKRPTKKDNVSDSNNATIENDSYIVADRNTEASSDLETVREPGKKIRKQTSSAATRAKKKRVQNKERQNIEKESSYENVNEKTKEKEPLKTVEDDTNVFNVANFFGEEDVMSAENDSNSFVNVSGQQRQTAPDLDGVEFRDESLLDIHDTNYLSSGQICSYLAGVCFHSNRRVAYLDSFYLRSAVMGRTPSVRNYLRIWRENLEFIFCPVHVNGDHWTLLVIDVLRKTATYFNTLPLSAKTRNINNNEKALCEIIINGLKTANIIDPATVLVKAHFESFNQQEDGYNCAVHVLFIAEDIAFSGSYAKIPSLNIKKQRQRIKDILRELYELNKDLDPLRKESLLQWPNRDLADFQTINNQEATDSTAASKSSTNKTRGRPPKICAGKNDDLEKLTPSQKLMPPPLFVIPTKKDDVSKDDNNESENESDISVTSDSLATTGKKKRGRPSKKEKDKKDPASKNCQPAKVVTNSTNTLRRSSRLAAKLPNLTPMTETCYYTRVGHKDGCASRKVNHKIDYKDEGDFNKKCKFCGAWKNEYEMATPNIANKCCNHGDLHTQALQETYEILENKIPELLLHLQNPDVPDHQKFEKNIIKYNSIVAFGSISTDNIEPLKTHGPPTVRLNGNIVHNASDFNPPEGKTRKFAQVYTVDLQEAEDAIEQNAKEFKLDDTIAKALMKMVADNHVFAPLFKSGSEKMAEAIAAAEAEGKEIPNFRLIIVDSREDKDFTAADPSIHPHRAEKPRNELVGMIWCNEDGEPPEYKGIWLNGRDGATHYVPYFSSNVDPLCYPILIPHGNQIFHSGISLNKTINKEAETQKKEIMNEDVEVTENDVEQHINGIEDDDEEGDEEGSTLQGGSKARQFASRRQVYRYYLYPRKNNNFKQPHWLWSKGPLADAFLIDIICRTERCQLNAAKLKIEQAKKRYTTKKELRNYIEKTYLKGKKLGKLFTIPSSFKGGRKYMQKAYSDIMTIIDNTDLPAWFITFTGNPKWPEITRNIRKGENRSDVKCRVFMAKAQEFLDDLLKRNVMGKVQAYHIVMEFQKRGMPHLHVILIMEDKVTVEDVDNYISARIPDLPDPKDKSEAANQQRKLHDIIMRNQIHLCNENSGCQVDGICTKGYKKAYVLSTVIHAHKPAEYERFPPKPLITETEQTAVNENASKTEEEETEENDEEETDYFDELRKDFDISHVEYERRPPPPEDAEVTEKTEHLFGNTYQKLIRKGVYVEIDDGHVVPYNPFLSLKYDCHINVECTVGQTGSPKYTCKYTTKLGDVVYAKVGKAKAGKKDNGTVDFDEGEQHICARVMTGCEAWMRLNNTWIIKQSHIVEALQIHLEGENTVVFEEGDETDAAEKVDKSHLIAFFHLCEIDPDARKFTFNQIPQHYRYDKKSGTFIKRKNNPRKFFVRINHVPPKEVELYALRILLMNVPGPKSYKDLKTVGKDEYSTFVQAAQKRGLWQDDEIHLKAIRDAFNEMRGVKQRRHYFAMVVAHNNIGKIDEFLEKFLDDLFLDYGQDPDLNREERRSRALNYLEFIFQKMGTSCRRLGFTVPEKFEDIVDTKEAEIDFDEPDDAPMINNRKVSPQEYAEAQRKKLNNDQKKAFKRIWDAVEQKSSERFFFLQGSGGTGKTFLYNCLINYCKAHGKHVVACASTGIAATLLKGGVTAHSAFFIPKELDHETGPRISAESKAGRSLEGVDLIIIDEVSMLHKNVLKFIDRTMQDVKGRKDLFGDAVVLIGGDWKQLTPVVPKAYPNEIINSSVKRWHEFKNVVQLNLIENMRVDENELAFIEDLKLIGNGSIGRFLPGSNSIAIDKSNIVKNEKELIDFCYEPEWLRNPQDHIQSLCGSAILCPTNTVVQRMNNDILSQLKGDVKTYKSIDTPLKDNDVAPFNGDITDFSMETMHKIETAGLPPHELHLKKGAIVMLIKNLSIFTGLCNGTRMQVVDMNEENLKCKVVSGPRSKNSELIFISRCTFQYGGVLSEPGIRFTRCQFPVKLSFAMTINKAQGQTLDRVGLYFRQGECFSHGQLYTALSRVRTPTSYKVLTAVKNKNTARNIVWQRLLND